MSWLLSKLGSGLGGIVAIIGMVLTAVVGVYAAGRRSKGAEDARDKAQSQAKAADEQLEMHREATAIEKQVGKLTAEQVDKELGTWDRK